MAFRKFSNTKKRELAIQYEELNDFLSSNKSPSTKTISQSKFLRLFWIFALKACLLIPICLANLVTE